MSVPLEDCTKRLALCHRTATQVVAEKLTWRLKIVCQAVLAKKNEIMLLAAHHIVKVDLVAHGEKLLFQLCMAEGVLVLKTTKVARVDRHS
jgi:hypothetical protein